MATRPPPPRWDNPGIDIPEEKRTEGWVDGEKPSAAYFNRWFHETAEYLDLLRVDDAVAGGRIQDIERRVGATGEWNYIAPKSKTIIMPSTAWLPVPEDLSRAGWRRLKLNVNDRYFHVWQSTDSQAVIALDIGAHLPGGLGITRVDIVVKPGATRASGGSRLRAQLLGVAPSFSSPGQVTLAAPGGSDAIEVSDNGATQYQVLTLQPAAGRPITVDRATQELFVFVDAGQDGAGAHNPDTIMACRVVVSDPGPRSV